MGMELYNLGRELYSMGMKLYNLGRELCSMGMNLYNLGRELCRGGFIAREKCRFADAMCNLMI